MIINLRGTHGSGKSTVATTIMRLYETLAMYQEVSGKPKLMGYAVRLPNGQSLYIVGKYETACGGCDGIQPYSDIWPRVNAAHEKYAHVLFEGALISTTFGSIGEAAKRWAHGFTYAFMDTPLEECVRRVNERRAAAGKPPIADTKNIDNKWCTIRRLQTKLTLAGSEGNQVATIRHTHAVKDTLNLLGIKLAKEPSHG